MKALNLEIELLELDINGIKLAIEDMRENETLTTEHELKMNNLINELQLKITELSKKCLIKEEKKEETKILKNEYELNFDGYTVISKNTNIRIDYSFPDGYEHVIRRRYNLDTLEFISEHKYYGLFYKNCLKTYNILNEMK
jgi:hypothetical protein